MLKKSEMTNKSFYKNRTKINQIVTLYKENFPMNWIDVFEWNSQKESDSLETVNEKINSCKEDIFFLFAKSVLSGEYVLRSEFVEVFEELNGLFINGEIADIKKNECRSIAIRRFNDMLFGLSRVNRCFMHLLTMLENKYNERKTKYIINAYRLKHDVLSRDLWDQLYDMLIDITYFDHFLSYDKKKISNLIIYNEELSKIIKEKSLKNNTMLVLNILKEKCLFLLKKLLIDNNKVFDYMLDFKHTKYDTSRIPFKYFSEMDKKFDFYREESYSRCSMGDELDYKSINRNLSIGQYTLLMKLYKDSNSTVFSQIDNILSDFDKIYTDLSSKFKKRPLDCYALATLKNYMYNCRFSFLIDEYTLEQLYNEINNIIKIQFQTGILNFYPYRKAFRRVLSLFQSDETLQREKLEKYKDVLNMCVSKFSEAIEWCNTNCFYPIQNVYTECLTRVEGFGVVFIASSYCRPVNYEKLKDELNKYKNQILLVDNEIALREEKKELKNLKKDIDNSKTKEIEILSAFTAIITFLFGTIGFFADNRNNDFIHLLFSIFGLGAVLLIFVSGIHLITMRKEKKVGDYFKHPRAWFCIVTILCSIGLLIWLIKIVQYCL